MNLSSARRSLTSFDHTLVIPRVAHDRLELARTIERLLYQRIGEVDRAIRALGYHVRIGFEDEVYIAGPRARTFLAKGSVECTRLRSEFPLVGRVYAEADVVALRGTRLRLGVPRVRKWEITTRHLGRDGSEISPASQARLVTAIREFIIDEAARTGHVAYYGARPIRDVRDLIGRPGLFRASDRELLASVKRQVRAARFGDAVRAHFRHRASDAVFRQLREALPDLSPTETRDIVRRTVYQDVDEGVIQLGGRALGRRVRRGIERERRASVATAARVNSGIGNARSFADLCREPDGLIEPVSVPACGVDVNLSALHGGCNAFHDAQAHDQGSALLHSVARALVACLGRDTGSLLPVAQSYSPETFERLFRVDLHVPDRASIGAKSSGAACKQSPDAIAANPSRAVEHSFDELGEDTIRLEMRAGEAGGGAGMSNPLSSPHSVLLMLIAARLGIDNHQVWSSPSPAVRGLPTVEQPLNISHQDSLSSFERSAVLQDGYGDRLHRLVAKHARLVLERSS